MSVPEDDLNQRADEPYRDLPRELDPGSAVEERIVRALKSEGLLRAAPRASGGRAWMLQAAAALVLFAGGLAAGEYHGTRRTEQRLAVAVDQEPHDPAVLVQRAGSAYVDALARLSETSAMGDSAKAAEGREAALSAFRSAVEEFHQAAPNDPYSTRLVDAMSASNPQTPVPALRKVVYY
jgi:hypothetical protein